VISVIEMTVTKSVFFLQVCGIAYRRDSLLGTTVLLSYKQKTIKENPRS
jgi:hypothetical protein